MTRRRGWSRLTGPLAVTLGGAALVTVVVRVVSLGSQGLLTSRFGAGATLDGFFLALIAPTLLAVPFAGAFELVLPARIARSLEDDPANGEALARRSLRLALVIGLPVALVATLASPLLVWLSAPSAPDAVLVEARSAALLVYPGIAFKVVSAAAAGILIGRGRINVPVMARAGNPIVLIGALVLLPTDDVRIVAAASLAGDLVEMVVVLLALRPMGRGSPKAGSEGFAPARRALWTVLPSLALVQVVPVVDQAFVAGVGAGALTTFGLALRLIESVRAILIVPFLRVALGRLGAAQASGGLPAVLAREPRRAVGIGVLASAAAATAGPLVVLLVFENGNFDRTASLATIRILLAFAPALLMWIMHGFYGRALIVLDRADLANRYMVLYVMLNLALDGLAVHVAGAPGVAAATGVSLLVTALLQRRAVRRAIAGRRPT